MFSSPFFRRLFLPYLLVICAATGAVGLFAARQLRDGYHDRTRVALHDESIAVEALISDPLRAGDTSRVQSLVAQLDRNMDCRITVIDSTGVVLADNEANPATMDNHINRPEMLTAAASGEGDSIRQSATLNQPFFYFARKVKVGDRDYYLRLSQHATSLDRQIHELYSGLGIVALIAIGVSAVMGYVIARRDTRPVIELTDFANTLARGEFGRRYLRTETGETAVLAHALNGMADSLSRLLTSAAEDNARLLAILGSMNEGVIAADTQQKILFTNESAGRLLGFGPEVAGQLLWEVVRSDAVQKLARDILSLEPPHSNGDSIDPPWPSHLAGRTTIHVGPLLGRHLEITACTFPLGSRPEGLILVAHDATQSVQYQELRKEFVANVSHELRTPLSIIKGFAETLRDGAMSEPARAAQYLATIEKHADQLTNLVSDLLELSRLDSQVGITRRAPVNVAALIRHVGELLLPAAQRKRHELEIELAPDLPETLGNVDYLERAVTNLIDNAIKYTPEGGRIHVSAARENGSVLIEVSDNGIGIPLGELPRIFERFYRVDRSRSRELGGTGLGLSIVKHVVQTHGGSIEADSAPGKGSTFRLRLPANEPG